MRSVSLNWRLKIRMKTGCIIDVSKEKEPILQTCSRAWISNLAERDRGC
jgi:hypothetical protein